MLLTNFNINFPNHQQLLMQFLSDSHLEINLINFLFENKNQILGNSSPHKIITWQNIINHGKELNKFWKAAGHPNSTSCKLELVVKKRRQYIKTMILAVQFKIRFTLWTTRLPISNIYKLDHFGTCLSGNRTYPISTIC